MFHSVKSQDMIDKLHESTVLPTIKSAWALCILPFYVFFLKNKKEKERKKNAAWCITKVLSLWIQMFLRYSTRMFLLHWALFVTLNCILMEMPLECLFFMSKIVWPDCWDEANVSSSITGLAHTRIHFS